ncbi:MAG: LPS export ABC transporter permease LptF [Pseudomonadota bacterium]
MSILHQYIFRATLWPTLFFSFVMIAIVWLSQALEFIDLVVNRGQPAGTFLTLSVLVLPSILKDALPIALFCAVLYGLHRLRTDSELVVMGAAGISRWRIASPILTLAVWVTLITYLISLFVMPLGYRAMKDRVHEIRGDLVSAIIKEGEFATPTDGLTVFVRELGTGGELRGILVHDSREGQKPTTYTAERGLLVRSGETAQLMMGSGTIQTKEGEGSDVSLITFERYTFDLTPFYNSKARSKRELTERFLPELFFPDESDWWAQRNMNEVVAEGHNRLASPLYVLAFALIGICAVLSRNFDRRGYGHRIVTAVLLVIGLRISGFAAQSLAADMALINVLQYAIPLVGIVGAGIFLFNFGARSKAERPSGELAADAGA